MAEITAKDVKALRDATGAGILDAKKALTQTNGDQQAAAQLLREKGLIKAEQRATREAAEGVVAASFLPARGVAALVQLKSETDFVAKSPPFIELANDLAAAVAEDGEGAVDARKDAIDALQVSLRENIQLGRVVRFEAAAGDVLEHYLHIQAGRGVNGVLVELAGGSAELAHDIAVHVAFGKPGYLRREEVPAEVVAAERETLESQTRNEGKPEPAVAKIVDGKMQGWYKRVPGGVLVEQPYAKDDKLTVSQVLGSATVVRFAQVLIGE